MQPPVGITNPLVATTRDAAAPGGTDAGGATDDRAAPGGGADDGGSASGAAEPAAPATATPATTAPAETGGAAPAGDAETPARTMSGLPPHAAGENAADQGDDSVANAALGGESDPRSPASGTS